MRKYLLILFLLLYVAGYSQNLVPNGSFEQIDSCPQFNWLNACLASPWFQPVKYQGTYSVRQSSSSDLYNRCAPFGSSSVPANNHSGHQEPYDGDSYVGIIGYYTLQPEAREYLEIGLTTALESNKRYCVEFYVSLADTSSRACNNLGVYFSIDSLLTEDYSPLINYIPQIECATVISDKIGWTLISGEFIAQGGEKFMTIGNFRSNQNTTVQILGSGSADMLAYYYLDAVSVTCCDPSGCEPPSPPLPEIPFSIPTLLSSSDLFIISGLDEPVSLTLYDIRGRKLYENPQYFNDLPLVSFAQGIYFYAIILPNGSAERGKLVISSK